MKLILKNIIDYSIVFATTNGTINYLGCTCYYWTKHKINEMVSLRDNGGSHDVNEFRF